MKIAINIQPMLNSGKSGIGFYQYEMVNKLLSADKENRYIFNFFDIHKDKLPSAEKLLRENTELSPCSWFSASLYHLIWSIIPIPYGLFFKDKPDVSAFFNYYLPPFVHGKRALVIYDTVIKDHPETVRFRTKTMLRLTLKKSIRRADRIITISQFSKEQIVKHFHVDPNRIIIIPCAVDREKFRPISDDGTLRSRICEKYNIDKEYYLYIGNLEPRKNILRLVEAYFQAQKQRELPQLVIAGGKGWLYEDIFRRVEELGLKDRIIFTGYVEDNDVPALMSFARAFCFPSLYEGFGMPPLEAMACGTPVIVSNAASLPEVVGDCGISVDPYDVSAISDALIKMLDDEFVSEQRVKSIERAAAFSWDNSAEILKKLFEELYNEQNTDIADK